MINALGRHRIVRRRHRQVDVKLNVATAAMIGRGVWRMYRGRSPWSAGRWRLSAGPRRRR
jgi:hypothetical protein